MVRYKYASGEPETHKDILRNVGTFDYLSWLRHAASRARFGVGSQVSYDLVRHIGAGHVFSPPCLAPTLTGAMGELSTMKRTLLTAAFAALTLGAVQATEIDWGLLPAVSGYASLGTQTSAGRQTGIELGTKWTVLANVTINDIRAINSGWPVLIGVSDNVDGDTNGQLKSPWRVLIDASRQIINATDANLGDSAPALTDGTHEVAITGDGTKLSYYYDGDLLGSITADGVANVSAITWGQQRPDYNVLPGEWSMDIAYVDGMTYDEVGDAIAALPEPTALALLALGVAGVALRRRVA